MDGPRIRTVRFELHEWNGVPARRPNSGDVQPDYRACTGEHLWCREAELRGTFVDQSFELWRSTFKDFAYVQVSRQYSSRMSGNINKVWDMYFIRSE